jgi:hypothetical protein
MDPMDLIKEGKIQKYFRPARNASQPARSCLAVAGGRGDKKTKKAVDISI